MNEEKKVRRISMPKFRVADRKESPAAGGSPAAARKGRFRLSRKEKMILMIPAAAAIVVVLAILLLLDRSVTCRVDSAAAQYYANGTFPIAAETALCREGDGTFYMKTGRQKQDLNNLPIYYGNRRSALLSRDMIYFAPRTKEQARVEFFSEILCSETGAIRVLRDGKEPVLDPGFLYDGKDLYLFLEPVTLHMNGYTWELPALSYVEAVYGGAIMVFHYETKEQLMESPQGDVTAEAADGDYTVSLLGDSMTVNDGTKSLLFTRPDLLESVKD